MHLQNMAFSDHGIRPLLALSFALAFDAPRDG